MVTQLNTNKRLRLVYYKLLPKRLRIRWVWWRKRIRVLIKKSLSQFFSCSTKNLIEIIATIRLDDIISILISSDFIIWYCVKELFFAGDTTWKCWILAYSQWFKEIGRKKRKKETRTLSSIYARGAHPLCINGDQIGKPSFLPHVTVQT